MTLTPGTKLEGYEIVAALGAGGMGEVYRARDIRLHREVAIKVVSVSVSRDPDRLRRFEQEARAAAALNHPNILAVFHLGTYQGAPYIVSELLEGSTLREHMARGPLPVRRVIEYGSQIARGMAAAHDKGIVHRDLKPENLFITKDARVKILDFGLAKLTQRASASEASARTATVDTEPGLLLGTVGYMSPEQVCGKPLDHRTDIFSLGAVLYETLTGKRAFQKPTSAETMSSIVNEEPAGISQILPSIPAGLQRVVHRCLEKDPQQRFQSASDLAFALDALSDSGSFSVAAVKRPRTRAVWLAGTVFLVTAAALLTGALLWFHRAPMVERSQWVQLTDLPDAVSQPALSPDGRMVTFIRGSSTFVGPGQIYVKMLPDGEPVELTHDDYRKMSPAFSPDGTRIAYTTSTAENKWDTWAVPVLTGKPQPWLPNASGLVWPKKGKVLFSEIKDNDLHMAIVTADESRAGERDVYVPESSRGMAHRSYPSPDGKWALVVEMERAVWQPCRLVPLDGSSASRQVGPAQAACTAAAWSPDGKWMYLNSGAGGAFHIWRQRFPNGQPEQITSGPTDEEGIAMAPDGHSFITAVGLRQSSVWLHDARGERQVSLEGFAYDPNFTPDGKKLIYRVIRGASPTSDPGELHVVELDSGRNEVLLPGLLIRGMPCTGYNLSPDGREVAFATTDERGSYRLWVAPLDHSAPPRHVPNASGFNPLFGNGGEIFFLAVQGGSGFAYRIHEDGTQLRKAVEQPVAFLAGISRDGQWLVAKVPGTVGSNILGFPLQGGSPIRVAAGAGTVSGDVCVGWSADGTRFLLRVPTSSDEFSGGRTYIVPLPPGRVFPPIPKDGFRSEEEIKKMPGVQIIPSYQVAPGPKPGSYAFVRVTGQRNLYRVPLP